MELDLIKIFTKVVQAGNYTQAAKALQIPKSTISRAVSRLEQESGTKLLLRTTRSVTLTSEGRSFYESCLGPLQQLEDARRALSGKDGVLTGLIKITAPEDLGHSLITPTISELSKNYSELKFEILYTNQIVDLVKDGFDLAIRIGELMDSELKAHKLFDLNLILVAAPKFHKDKKISTPEDLANVDCLSICGLGRKTIWKLRSKKSRKSLLLNAKIVCNQMSSLMSMAENETGVALVPSYLCRDKIRDKKLVQVLPDYYADGFPVWLVSPFSMHNNARLKLLSDELKANLKKLVDKL